ncbi:protein LKAAEAR1-like [Actinia tenebrosa]|uniref:Protein LKAAEAR1-like n=1 Tax=Actinia tenebrosa TaxID=6105 RepID=A0A6P8H7X3_ACTTE|nr:protein LKAAEAR1-like [Actinia tenebrosa]
MESGSKVKLPNIREAEGGGRGDGREKFQAKNWKNFSKKELQKLSQLERSKYLAYESAPKDCVEAMSAARKRLKELKKEKKMREQPKPMEEVVEEDKHTKLIGQLKAAEARNRLRLMRLRYNNNRASEVNHLISCQPTALKAVRLQSLVPPYTEKIHIRDLLGKNERGRINALLEDETGLETSRILS